MTYPWSPASLLQTLATISVANIGIGARPGPVINFDDAPPSPYLEKLSGIKPDVSFVEAHGGVKLRVAQFEPPQKPLFTLLLAPGVNSPIEFHRRLATVTTLLGARTFVYDPRSQGFSGRTTKKVQRLDVLHEDDHVRDMKLILEKVVQPKLAGELRIAGFSMGGLHMLLGLAHKEIFADRAIAVAPAILPLDLPHGSWIGSLKEAWIKGNQITYSSRGIEYDPKWDYSREQPTPEWHRDNIYANNPPMIDQVWKMLQLPGDMLRPGMPTARWIGHLINTARKANALPAGCIETPLNLILARNDRVVSSEAALAVCSRIAPNFTAISVSEPHALELATPNALRAIVREITTGLAQFPSRMDRNNYTPVELQYRSDRERLPQSLAA